MNQASDHYRHEAMCALGLEAIPILRKFVAAQNNYMTTEVWTDIVESANDDAIALLRKIDQLNSPPPGAIAKPSTLPEGSPVAREPIGGKA